MIEKLQAKTIEKDGGAFGIIIERRFATEEEMQEKINELVDAVNELKTNLKPILEERESGIKVYEEVMPNMKLADPYAEQRNMMKDPKYWRDKDPETVRRVEEGFKKLYGDKGEQDD